MTLPARPRARKRLVQRLLLAAGVAGLGLALAEALVRARGWARNVGPSFTEWDERDGVRMRRGMSCVRTTPEFTFRISSNARGFRGPELPERIERSILFLGDSFTMGYGVGDGAEFVALLARRAAPGWTLVNAGLGGTGNGRWIHVLERDAPDLRPALVVLQACENDLEDNLADGLYVQGPAGDLIAVKPPEAGLLRALARIVEVVPGLSSSHLVALGRNLRRTSAQQATAPPAGEEARTAGDAPRTADGDPRSLLARRLIERAIDTCRERGWLVLGIVCAEDAERRALLTRTFAERGVKAVVAPTKAEHPEQYWVVDGHWNEAGHAAMAELVERALAEPPYADLAALGSR